ncbi:MAG TPA: hypothetical protein VFA91_14970, partial [Candidatus Polarisedimenticolia bacterium]|nr:hypothetical protein [Candidatus Polarisedimenticolia bacterium]
METNSGALALAWVSQWSQSAAMSSLPHPKCKSPAPGFDPGRGRCWSIDIVMLVGYCWTFTTCQTLWKLSPFTSPGFLSW